LCRYCACKVACAGDLAKSMPAVTPGQKLMYCGEGVFDVQAATEIAAKKQAEQERQDAELKKRLDGIYPL
jgi:hypothetical protein